MEGLIVVLSILSLGAALFTFFFTAAGDPRNSSLWCMGLFFLAFSGLGPLVVINSIRRENARKAAIQNHAAEWGADICQTLINKNIRVDMTEEMVRLAWNNPSYVDDVEITKNGKRERWVYGTPRRGANYVWFKNSVVTKIKT
jgi:hypothetical protein